MKHISLQALAISAFAAAPALSAQSSIDDTKDVLEQWVETRQLISQETSDWKTEKAIVTDTVNLLENELKHLEEAIEELNSSATAADEERAELTAKRDMLDEGSKVVLENLTGLETEMKAIIERLPEPLTSKIQPLIRRLPDDPETTKLSLGERVQNIVGILSQAGKFNSTITLTSETQELDNGKLVQVNTLYWGTAIAYFVDDSATYAGYGVPAAGEWEWTQVDGAGPAIRELLSVYDGSSDTIKFVQVPAIIK